MSSSNQQDDEEARLVQAVGGTVESMDTYETSVLQEATLASAPQLSGVGIPDVEQLLPSYSSRKASIDRNGLTSDLSHVRTVLARVRAELKDCGTEEYSKRVTVLRMKEQMLLVCLQSGPPGDFPVHPFREVAHEQKRSNLLTDARSFSRKKPVPASKKFRRERVVPQQSGEWSTQASERLEQIKKGMRSVVSASETASFGKQALLDRQLQRVRRKRKTMMEEKKIAPSQDVDEREDVKALQSMLLERRQERQERKRQRRERWVAEDDETESEVEFEPDEESENEEETGESSERVNDAPGHVNDEDTGQSEEPTESVGHEKEVQCPLCELTIRVDPKQDPDSALAAHIEECQQQQGTRRSRRTRAASVRKEPVPAEPPSKPRLRQKKLKAPKKTKRTKTIHRKPPPPKPSIDDTNEFDYEDRVDDWMETGLAKMKDMQERDTSEEQPGAETYPGGLVVPAWINNRLFGYQRLGLRWMWELYLQEAGGIGKCVSCPLSCQVDRITDHQMLISLQQLGMKWGWEKLFRFVPSWEAWHAVES